MRNYNPPHAVVSGITTDKQWMHPPMTSPFAMMDRPPHHTKICLPRLLHDHTSKYYPATDIPGRYHHHLHHGHHPYRRVSLSPTESGVIGGSSRKDYAESPLSTSIHSSISPPSSFSNRHSLPPRAASAELAHVSRSRDRSSPCESLKSPEIIEHSKDKQQPFLYTLPSPHLLCQCRSCYIKHIEHVYSMNNDKYNGVRNRIAHKRDSKDLRNWEEEHRDVVSRDRKTPESSNSPSLSIDHIKEERMESPSTSPLENSVE